MLLNKSDKWENEVYKRIFSEVECKIPQLDPYF